MDGVLRTCGADWKCSAECGLSVLSNLLVLMCAGVTGLFEPRFRISYRGFEFLGCRYPSNAYEITLLATDAEIHKVETHNMELLLRCYY
jgi:hypothetical protein